MIRRPGATLLASLVLFSCFAMRSEAGDRSRLGVRFGAYTDSDSAFIGGEGLIPISRHVDFNPNLEFVFVDPGTFFTGNFDLAYNLPDNVRNADFWAGGGLAILYRDRNDFRGSSTNVGVNLFMGAGLHTGTVTPYVQLKGVLAENSSFVFGLGLRF